MKNSAINQLLNNHKTNWFFQQSVEFINDDVHDISCHLCLKKSNDFKILKVEYLSDHWLDLPIIFKPAIFRMAVFSFCRLYQSVSGFLLSLNIRLERFGWQISLETKLSLEKKFRNSTQYRRNFWKLNLILLKRIQLIPSDDIRYISVDLLKENHCHKWTKNILPIER